MLSHMNEVDPFIFRYVFLYEIQNFIFLCFTKNWSKSWPNCLFAKVVTFEESKGSTTPHQDDCRSQLLHMQICRQVETFFPTPKEVEGFSMDKGVSRIFKGFLKSFLQAENVFSPGFNSFLTCSMWNFVHVFGCHQSCSEWGPNLNRIACLKNPFPVPKIDQLVDASFGHLRMSFLDAF